MNSDNDENPAVHLSVPEETILDAYGDPPLPEIGSYGGATGKRPSENSIGVHHPYHSHAESGRYSH